MHINFSFIVPVFNRPQEIRELLQSMQHLEYSADFEVVIVEDGSTQTCQEVIEDFSDHLQISYFQKPNSGPGNSRNCGMKRGKGNYFLILDSDVLLPKDYLDKVEKSLKANYVHCFGGPDAAHAGFSDLQKAINYAMTSYLTTGGIRGRKRQAGTFEPRSFNMGLSKEAFEASHGFGRIHPGEDPDLVLRLRKMGYQSALISTAGVFHKRRISWGKFYKQVHKFGMVRPILNKWHPQSRKLTYWFPMIFSMGLVLSLLLLLIDVPLLVYLYSFYFLLILLHASVVNKSFKIGFLAVWASLVQFLGYGYGFCTTSFFIGLMKQDPEKRFPQLFFKNAKNTKGHYQNQVQEN